MQIALSMLETQRHNRQTRCIRVAQYLQVRLRIEYPGGSLHEVHFASLYFIGSDFLLQLENQACSDRFYDGWSPALFAAFVVFDVAMVLRRHIGHGAATNHGGDAVIQD